MKTFNDVYRENLELHAALVKEIEAHKQTMLLNEHALRELAVSKAQVKMYKDESKAGNAVDTLDTIRDTIDAIRERDNNVLRANLNRVK